MTAYRYARVVGAQGKDGSWPGEVLSPQPDGSWKAGGRVAVLSGNGLVPVEGFIYPGAGDAWVVVVNPTPPRELAPEDAA